MNALNFINGVFVDATDGQTLTNLNPATGQTIGTIARSKDDCGAGTINSPCCIASVWSRRGGSRRVVRAVMIHKSY